MSISNSAEQLGRHGFEDELGARLVEFSQKPVSIDRSVKVQEPSVSKELMARFRVFVDEGRTLTREERTARLAKLEATDKDLYAYVQEKMTFSMERYAQQGRKDAAREFAVKKGLEIVDNSRGKVLQMRVDNISAHVSDMVDQNLRMASGE